MRTPWVLLALLTAVAIAYAPAWHGGLLWDDDAHVTPAALRSAAGLWRIWFDIGATQQYYPLLYSAFWGVQRIFGDSTTAYHLLNIGLHAVSACLVWRLLTGLNMPGALLAATLFALHPVQVETVAWISELKNVMSGVFYLSALTIYLQFDDRRERRLYMTALALFVLALLSKTVTATLPGAVLVILWWRRGRLAPRRDVWPLIPFLGLGAAAGVATAWIEHALVGAQGRGYELSVIERGLLASRGIWFYLFKLVWPANLIFVYPKWTIDGRDARQYVYLAALIVLFASLWALRTRTRAPLAALLFFCVTLFPALGFINVYPFRYSYVADHFQYLACLGLFTLVGAGIATIVSPGWASWRSQTAIALAVAAPLGGLTWRQSRQYADAETLYRTTLSRNPAASLASINLGLMYLNGPQSSWPSAAQYLTMAAQLDPGNDEAQVNLGAALQKLGRPEEAAVAFEQAIRLNPGNAGAHNNLGTALEKAGRIDDAARRYAEAIRLAPASSESHANLGRTLLANNRPAEAVAALREAARLGDSSGATSYMLANALFQTGALTDAIACYAEALKDPALATTAEVHNDFGVALARAGRVDEAIVEFGAAVRLEPGFAEARANLARAQDAHRQGRL